MRRPRVTVFLTQSIDGRLALRGKTTALSTPEGRRAAHTARAMSDAILVGASTVRIDDPQLTVREAPSRGKAPLRVVVASGLDVPEEARVVGGGTLVIGAEGRATETSRARLVARGADVSIVTATADGLVDVDAALDALAARGVERVLVEGGARIVTSFLRARAVDRMSVEIAMKVLGEPGTSTVGPLGVTKLGEAPGLTNVSVERAGTNVIVTGDVVHV